MNSQILKISCIVFLLVLGRKAEAQYNSWNTFKAQYGTISFSYPSGWEVGEALTGNKNRYTENYMMQPRGQVFGPRYGQVVIRVFDPVYVMENVRANNATLLTKYLFEKFVADMCEVSSALSTEMTFDGGTYYEYMQNNQGYQTKIVGKLSPFGFLYVVMMACAPTTTEANDIALYQVAASMRGGEPRSYLSTEEMPVKQWYTALQAGNSSQMSSVSCTSARAMNIFGGDWLAKFGTMFDFSKLTYYTTAGNDELKVVRVCGCVIDPQGKWVPFYEYANRMGNSNLFIVRKESGSWKICENFKR